MIVVRIGNLFDSKAQTLVNTVNCVGIMGKGIALEFKKRFPKMFKEYSDLCSRNEVKLGFPYLYKDLIHQHILNFPTKEHWRSTSKLEDIIKGLEYLLKFYKEWGITSLAVPPLGCGEGQLEWRIVGPTLYRYLNQMDIPIELYAPHGTPHEELMPEFLEHEANVKIPEPQKIQPVWVAIVEILNRIEKKLPVNTIGRTMFQKIAHSATEEGLPTDLDFQQNKYGPFATNFNDIKKQLVNNGLIYEERIGNKFAVRIGRTFEDARKAYVEYLDQWNPIIEKVTNLFINMNSDL